MNTGSLVALLLAALVLIAAIARLGLDTWVKTLVEKSVASKFEKELEALRSDLRLKESQITALQTNVLSGRAGRQAMLDKRRFEAIETLWREVLKLSPFTWPAAILTILKIDEVSKRATRDPKVREFIELIQGSVDLNAKLSETKQAEIERPFVPSQVWKLFAAYRGLLLYCYMRVDAARVEGAAGMMKDEKMIADIKEVMPHFSDYLDKYGISGAAGLATPLRELVFEALRSALASNEGDVENMAASKAILSLIDDLNRKMVEGIQAS